jgi:N-acetylneuraminic acid mutarotase
MTSEKLSPRRLTFAERVAYQRAIEDVYWRHRIWPTERKDPKPSLDAIMSQAQIEKKVTDYLRNSQAQRLITAEQLQAEMDRMALHTKQPEVLQELFEALGNDPFVIAECLVRPVMTERLLAHPAFEQVTSRTFSQIGAATASYALPTISDPTGGCADDTWTATSLVNVPTARSAHTAVWTGTEMIVWGGQDSNGNVFNTGGKYNPSTDSWTATSTTNAPDARFSHTAVWTGIEMIIWGGWAGGNNVFNTGGRYNPATDSWMATSTTNVPEARFSHTAVWVGSEMIVWGGFGIDSFQDLNTGGRYNPNTDSWTATSTAAPAARETHTAVWAGSEMIVWGGYDRSKNVYFNTGGRYNPSIDSWTSITTIGAPSARGYHTAVWTDSAMIIWGGYFFDGTDHYLDTGGRYNPSTNSWTPTSLVNVPDGRGLHTAVWTGTEMIVWGGNNETDYPLTGGRYNPIADIWMATSTTNPPTGRSDHTAVWTGSEMIVWGGSFLDFITFQDLNSGGRYCAQSGPTPTPSPTPTTTPTPTPTATPRATPRPRPTPHLRPTPA